MVRLIFKLPLKLARCRVLWNQLEKKQLLLNMARHGSLKVLNVAEKNDAAKRISELLSNRQLTRREGFSKYNKIYEFNYFLLGENCQMVMTSLSGHLLNYEFAGIYRKWYSCHPSQLFAAEVSKEVTENMINIKRTLEKEIRSCRVLVIWTDCDREGENIGYEVINVCQNINPNVRVYRAKFSEITERSVKTACQNLAQPNKNISDAVDVRQELDLRIGAAFTRFQTLRLQKVFPSVLSDQVISYGSCQFPTLGFVVERYKAREQFQPEPFYKIEVEHVISSPNEEPITTFFNWKRHRLFDQLAVEVLFANCTEPPAIATVTAVNSRPRSRWRPVALETVELEKLSSRKLRINAKETMRIAEKLYTQGFISYPRTETNIFPKDIDLRKLVEEQTHHPTWGGFAQSVLELDQGPIPRNGKKTDKAHPPIHPTKFTNSLSGNEARVYELIVRHFLACCHRDAQGYETTVDIELGGEKFSAQGLMITQKNYLEIYIYDKWNAKVISVYEVGQEFEPSDIKMTNGSTTAPPLLTEADLIALMDKHGIGTDATHAEHIEKIKQRSYVGLTPDQRFLPGELGMGLVEGYNLMGHEMSRPELRAELEADLRRICDGQAAKDGVLRRHIAKYKSVFEDAMVKANKLDEALGKYFGSATAVDQSAALNPSEVSSPMRPCPNCGRDMIIKRKKDGGFMVSCMGYPQCSTAAFLPPSVLSISVDDSICSSCRPSPVHKVKLKLRRADIPAYMDTEQITCICGCDEDIANVLGVRFRANSSNTSQNQQPYNRTPLQGTTTNIPRTTRPGFLGNVRPNSGNPQKGAGKKRSASGKRKNGSAIRKSENHSDDDAPQCNCGLTAVQLTVRKEGPNTGRLFYKCPKSNGVCDFFVWADAPPNRRSQSTSNSKNTSNNTHRSRVQSAPPSSRNAVKCRCNIEAVERTVQKDGPNKGRLFRTCPKSMSEKCGFFEWVSESGTTNSSGPSSSFLAPAQPRGPRKPPTCSLCKETGHTRRSCPNK